MCGVSQSAVPAMLRKSEVAKLLFCHPRTVDNMRRDGRLQAAALPGGKQFRYPTAQPALAPFLPQLAG